jgi:hypothetical protein
MPSVPSIQMRRSSVSFVYLQDARCVSICRFNVTVVIAAAAGVVNTREMKFGGVDEDEITGVMVKRSKFLGIRPR